MNPWIVADLHLDHTGLSDDGFRPVGFSEKEMRALTNCLKGDPVIFLGDISFHNEDKWHPLITALPGKKWLVLGNHDKRSASWYLDRGWDFVGNSFELEMFGKRILFSHMPQVVQSSTMVTGPGIQHYVQTGYDLNIHGHFHTFGLKVVQEKEPHLFNLLTPRHYLIAAEKLNYQPVKLDWVVKQAQKTHTLKQMQDWET